MKILGYIWHIVTNLITLGIILVLFEKAYTNFESTLLAVLVIIYFGYIERTSLILQDGIATRRFIYDMTRGLRQKLEDNFSKESEDSEMEEHSKLMSIVKNKFNINSAFHLIIFVFCIFQILK